MKLLWKEWQQQKWLFLFACLVGIILPIYDMFKIAATYKYPFPTSMGGVVVMVSGVLFAIILAVAATHKDSIKGVDTFLASKPLAIGKLFAVKYLLGAAGLAFIFFYILTVDFFSAWVLKHQVAQLAWTAFCYTYPLALFLFAAAMLLVIVLRDNAKTVLLSIWLALLLYFLPLMLNSLEWLNVLKQFNTDYHPSLLDYIVQRWYRPDEIDIQRPSFLFGIPQNANWTKALWHIVSSSAFLEYLYFLGTMLTGAIGCVMLSIAAFKRHWRWQPGQKTIVWSLGLSGAFIFGIAMLQVGHNLEPIKEWNGKKLINPAVFNWTFMPSAILEDGLPKGQYIKCYNSYFSHDNDAVCIKDDLMFRISCGYQETYPVPMQNWQKGIIRHFMLQIYRFPYADNNKAKSDPKVLPNYFVGAARLFSTELIPKGPQLLSLGCFIKGNYLYAAYRPEIITHENNKTGLRPFLCFATVDISNPEKPSLVGNLEINPAPGGCKGFAVYGDYCYFSNGLQLIIVSVAQADSPKVVRQIPYISGTGQSDTTKNDKDNYVLELSRLPGNSFTVIEDKLLCSDYDLIVILDLDEPAQPKILYKESFAEVFPKHEGIQAAAYRDDYLYLSTNQGLYVYKLTRQPDGEYTSELAGQRIASPVEKFAERRPAQLLFHHDYLIENSGRFGLIVYDIADPQNPTRAFHAVTQTSIYDIGVWNDLLFTQEYNFQVYFFDIPKIR